ncbi:methyltransferase [Planctomicrobium sp. SH661]|uniref:methyltransferase n=1 Tax=Planctomicrobium sp. SH661 TaxID=3448124 RepID=UPI003F5B2934
MSLEASTPDAAPVLDLLVAFRKSKAMFAAVQLGLFDALYKGPKPLAELNAELKTHEPSLLRLVDALVGMQLLQRDGDKYANSPAADAYLTAASPCRLTGYINFSSRVGWKLWGHLEDGVREGTHRWSQTFGDDQPIFSHFYRDERDKREFLMGMHGFGLISSPHVVKAFDLSRFKQLVDLGGATGHLTMAACQQYPQLRGCVFDLPEAIPLAREIVAASPVADRIEVTGGDFFTDALPEADLYALGRILHDWSEEKSLQLLRKIHAALPTGGALLVAEKLVNPDRTGPEWAQMQDLNMLVCTEGRERTLAEYEQLLKSAGFNEVSGCVTDSPADAILAVKA